ncbi:MAG: hypothetical protein R3B68_11335 [Phycisphaerales bacterium]
MRLRADLVARALAVKTQVLATLRLQRIAEPPDARHWTRAWLAWLASPACGLSEQARFGASVGTSRPAAGRIAGVEARLAEATAGDAVVERLMSVKGVGRVTAWDDAPVIGRFDRLRPASSWRFCSVTPRASSGQRVADAGARPRGGRPAAQERADRGGPPAAPLRAPVAATVGLDGRAANASVIVAAVANRWVRWSCTTR